jgi:hypothetical protein
MPDREKVIDGLECCAKVGKDLPDCDKCPYTGLPGTECYSNMFFDALELLKEQEPVEAGTDCEDAGDFSSWWYVCGNCGGTIDYHDDYCRHCGRKVKWDAAD